MLTPLLLHWFNNFYFLYLKKPYFVGSVVEKRDVLLCNGKLRLGTVQQTFGLSLIEMLHGR